MDRSCVMEHDDNSTDVQYGETTWGCCGQTVEGDGSDGPPAGWCYEGKHTASRPFSRYLHGLSNPKSLTFQDDRSKAR